jgi:predicted aldo/keto reductase-like oxidoreductase
MARGTMKDTPSMGRRGFLRAGAVAATAGVLPLESRPAGAAVGAAVARYVPLGRTHLEIADITFGSSRLRTGEEDLVKYAFDRGINYFDTAESYTRGQSETVIGNALVGKRDKVIIASKTSTGGSTSRGEMMAALDGSLRRLRTDYIDVFFTHAVNSVERLSNPEWHAFTEEAKRQGKIRFTGMSGHAGHLIECLDYAFDHDMVDVVLVAYNFGQDPKFYEKLTESYDFVARQPDLPRVLAKAKQKNVGVVTMKTLMGARLNDMRRYEKNGATFAQAAFRWVLGNPNVDALTVSMTSEELIDEYLGASGSTALAYGDFELLKQYAHLNGTSYCRHACNDCEGACPYGVPIADVLRTRMYATHYNDLVFARDEYRQLEVAASACLSCSGEPCRNACTHGLHIDQLCAPTHRLLA